MPNENISNISSLSSKEPSQVLKGKRIVMIIAFKNFKDTEYFVTREVLEKAGASITVASNKKGIAQGIDGGEANIDALVSDIDPTNFNAIVFIGGPGCLENLDNETSYQVIKETVSQNKLLASICISPLVLARAGVLKGKRATVWSSATDKSSIRVLEDNGATYQKEPVVQDGNIITAWGPDAAEFFGKKIIEYLTR